MPTIVDSLIVSLKLDPSGFKKGRDEATRAFVKVKYEARKSGKAMEEQNKLLGDTFAKVRMEALGFFAALLGAPTCPRWPLVIPLRPRRRATRSTSTGESTSTLRTTDAHGIASELTASLERSTMAMLAQSGQV